MLDECEACKNILRVVAAAILGLVISVVITFSTEPDEPTAEQVVDHPEWLYTVHKLETYHVNGQSFQRVWFLPGQKDGKVLSENEAFEIGDKVIYAKYSCGRKRAGGLQRCRYKYLGRQPRNT